AGPLLVLVLLGCGLAELVLSRRPGGVRAVVPLPLPLLALLGGPGGGPGALVWTALKVGALSYGGGFVIVPLMQADAVERYGWMSEAEFLSAVALGQLTPGPVVQTVAAVGYAAAGTSGAVLAAAAAFGPSLLVVPLLGRRLMALRDSPSAEAFLRGAGPAALGAIAGASVPLALALTSAWQVGVLAVAAVLLLRCGVVPTLLCGAALGLLAAAGDLPA
ncbi:MAG: chromate transporter, partial [Actinomycetota bacterium]|nr:chromate transporter [Actinomycetota bacterium]